METVKNIYQRVNQVMAELESVQKENKKVNGQYTFVSHDAVMKAIHMPMVRAGIVMIPSVDEIQDFGNKVRVKMVITFVNIDNPEDRYSVIQYGDGIDNQDKGIGKAVSYAVKYAILKAFALETGDDVEKDNINFQPVKKTSASVDYYSDEERKATEDEVSQIMSIVEGDQERFSKTLSWAGKKEKEVIKLKHYHKIVQAYEKKKNKAEEVSKEKIA